MLRLSNKNANFYLVLGLFVLLCFQPCNAEINLDNLVKQAKKLPDKSTATATAGSEIIDKSSNAQSAYEQDEDARAEEARRRRAAAWATSSSSPNNSSLNSTEQSKPVVQSDVYKCKVYCESPSGPVTYATVNANSRQEAAEIVGDKGHEICRDSGYSKASDRTLPASQCSRQ